MNESAAFMPMGCFTALPSSKKLESLVVFNTCTCDQRTKGSASQTNFVRLAADIQFCFWFQFDFQLSYLKKHEDIFSHVVFSSFRLLFCRPSCVLSVCLVFWTLVKFLLRYYMSVFVCFPASVVACPTLMCFTCFWFVIIPSLLDRLHIFVCSRFLAIPLYFQFSIA